MDSYYKYMATLLRKLKVHNSYKAAQLFSMEDRHFFYKDWHNATISYGGGIDKVLKINVKYKTADDKIFEFTVRRLAETDRISFSVINELNEINDDNKCIVIFYDPEYEFCYIDGIFSDQIDPKIPNKIPQCYLGIEISNKGSLLLNFTMDFIEQYIARKYTVKYIQLRDNSFKKCKSINTNIELDSLYMFTHGTTWYSKYGFLPFNSGMVKTDELYLNNYIKNQHIVRTILVKNTKIKQYISKAMNKLGIVNKKIFQKIDEFNDEPIQYFFDYFLKHFNMTCAIFAQFYHQLMVDLKMINLHGRIYWKQLSNDMNLSSDSFVTKSET